MALVTVLTAMMLLMALGAGSVLITITETRIAAVYRRGLEAFHAAEAGVAIVLGELATLPDWTGVLSGATGSPRSDGSPTRLRSLADGRLPDLARETNLLRCGRVSQCTDSRMDARTLDRPWGRNNPRWQVYLHAPLGELLGEPGAFRASMSWFGSRTTRPSQTAIRCSTGEGKSSAGYWCAPGSMGRAA